MPGLNSVRPTWDQTRAQSGGDYVYEDDDALIATDFECGNGRGIRRTARARYALALEPEPGHHAFSGQSYYFCFGIRNKTGRERRVTVELRNEGFPQWYDQTQHVVTRRGDAWGHLTRESIRGFPADERLELALDLPASDTPVFYSNFHWYPYTDLVRDLRAICEPVVIGRSFEGRDLLAVEVGPVDAPCLVMSQTPQPSEMGQWSCMACLTWLLGDDPDARGVRERHRVCVIPNTNPDGTVMGLGVSDAQGRFPYFEAIKAVEGRPEATPENVAVWRYLERVKPWLFIEWHSNNWSRRPGHVLLRYAHMLMADPARRRMWDAWEEALLRLPETYHGNWTSHDSGLYQASMGFAAVVRLQTIACMIKHHDRFELADILQHARASFRAAIDVWEANGRDTT